MIRLKENSKIKTLDNSGIENGFLVPIYNINDNFCENKKEPQQVYLTVVNPKTIKGPHLHFIRTGYFTCIKGNVRIIAKINKNYEIYYSGEDHNYRSIIIPTGVPAVIQNLSETNAYVLNMPSPAWTPEMDDEYSADFSDFNFETE